MHMKKIILAVAGIVLSASALALDEAMTEATALPAYQQPASPQGKAVPQGKDAVLYGRDYQQQKEPNATGHGSNARGQGPNNPNANHQQNQSNKLEQNFYADPAQAK